MPLPPLLFFALVTGLAAALAGRQEIRASPRPLLLTRAFAAYASYAVLLVVPVSVYFYVFHGDWFLLYALDVNEVPSAIALIGFVLEAGLGYFAFLAGAALVRSQREVVVGVLLGALVLGGAITVMIDVPRLAQVGSYAQYHGQFGLEPYEDGPLMTGGITMASILLLGLTFLLGRLFMTGRPR